MVVFCFFSFFFVNQSRSCAAALLPCCRDAIAEPKPTVLEILKQLEKQRKMNLKKGLLEISIPPVDALSSK